MNLLDVLKIFEMNAHVIIEELLYWVIHDKTDDATDGCEYGWVGDGNKLNEIFLN
jgi:hypothetical protein